MPYTPFQPFEKGYDLNAVNQANPPGANGILVFRQYSVLLWVYELTSDFAMAGNTGQSYRTRSYFPHNFVQPSFSIKCQFANQKAYSKTIEMIRHTQTNFDSSVKITVVNNSPKRGRGVKGAHRGNAAEGYIKSVKRLHERYVYSPELQIDFVIEKHLSPPGWSDNDIDTKIKVLPTWKDVIESRKSGFLADPSAPSEVPDGPSTVAPDGNGGSRPT